MNNEVSPFSSGKDSSVELSVKDDSCGLVELDGPVDELQDSVTSVFVDDQWPGQILVEGVDEFG